MPNVIAVQEILVMMKMKRIINSISYRTAGSVSFKCIRAVSIVFATAVLLFMTSISTAATYISTFDPPDFQLSHTFDLTIEGFDPLAEVVDSAVVVVVFVRDLWSPSPNSDQVWSLWVEDNDSVTKRSSYYDGFVAASIRLFDYTPIETDGTLDFGVTPASGVYIGASTLTITTSPAVVPVPSAVWLFGSGLLGLIGVARRMKA